MKKILYRFLAVIICIFIFIIYGAIASELGWKHGGGVLVLVLLVGVLRWVWKTVGRKGDKEKTQKSNVERVLSEEENSADSPLVSHEDVSPEKADRSDDLPPIPEDIEETINDDSPAPIDIIPESPTKKNIPFSFKKVFLKCWRAILYIFKKVSIRKENSSKKRKVWVWSIGIIVSISLLSGISLAIIVASTDIPSYVHGTSHRIKYALGMKDDAVAWELYRLAKEAKDNDMHELAEEYLKLSLDKVDKDKDLLIKLARMSNDFNLWSEVYSACCRQDYQNDSELMSIIAILKYEKEDYDAAIKLAQKAYLMNPANGRIATIVLYAIYEQRKDWENTLKWANKSLELGNEIAQTYYVRAKALYYLSKYDASVESYQKGVEIDAHNKKMSYGKEEYEKIITKGAKHYSSNLNISGLLKLHCLLREFDIDFTRTFPEFIDDMHNEGRRQRLFNSLQKYHLTTIKSYNDFYRDLGLIK